MNIHSVNKNKFIVELSAEDMSELDITYEEMDYSDIETRRVIWTILDRVRESTGRDVDPSGNLLIEAAADSDGGCILCFTMPSERRIAATVKEPAISKHSGAVYEFDCADSLLDMLKAVGKESLPKSNRLYKCKSRYRLVLPKLPGNIEKKKIEEYGKLIGRDSFSVAVTLEHWESAGKI